MSLIEIARDQHNNPLDVVERMAAGNNWPFERAGEDEIALVVTGRWTNYQVSFTWMSDIEALHLACAFDMKVPEPRLAEVQQLIALINEQLWIGHFDVWMQNGMVMFRHALVLAGGVAASGRQCEAVLGTRARFLRALFSGVSVRDLGGQVGARGDGLRDVRDLGRGVTRRRRAMTRARSSEPRMTKTYAIFPGLLVSGRRRQDGRRFARRLAAARPRSEKRRGAGAAAVAGKSPRSRARLCGSIRMPQALANAAAIVIAVKPQAAAQAMPPLAPLVAASTVVVSIMAGRTLQFLSGTLPRRARMVRAMPNTPAAIGRGITVAVPHNASAAQRDLARSAPCRDRGSRVDRRRNTDGRSNRGVGFRTRLRLPARRNARPGRRGGRPAAAARGKARARNRRRRWRAVAPLAARRRGLARKRDLAWRHDRRGADSADGPRAWRR